MKTTSFTATQINKTPWLYIDTALRGPVKIMKNNRNILITMTPQDLEDLIDWSLASLAIKEWIASDQDVENLYKKIGYKWK